MSEFRVPAARVAQTLPFRETFAGHPGDCAVKLSAESTYLIRRPLFVESAEPIPPGLLELLNTTRLSNGEITAVHLQNCSLLRHSSIISRDGTLLEDLLCGDDRIPARLENHADGTIYARFKMEPAASPAIEEPAALLFWHRASGAHHSHWLIQTLPRLELLRRAGADFRKIVVQDTIAKYQIETLEVLGFSSGDLIVRNIESPYSSPSSCTCLFKDLFATNIWPHVLPKCEAVDRLISHFSAEPRGPEKIYVARLDSPGARRFLNERSVIDVLERKGYTVVVPSELSLAQEVSMFRDARLIVGPLGAGLYNAMFTRSGAQIVVIGAPQYVIEWPLQMAAHYEHSIGFLFGNSFLSWEGGGEEGSHSNWVLDPEELLRVLREI